MNQPGSWESTALFLLAGAATIAFAWVYRSMWAAYRDRPERGSEHALVVTTALLVIALGNVMTGAGFVLGWDDLVTMGAIVVRGALVGVAAYLVFRHPRYEE